MAVDPKIVEEMRKQLRAALTCPICGLPKVHSRLRGYHCHFEQHNELAREMDTRRATAIGKDD